MKYSVSPFVNKISTKSAICARGAILALLVLGGLFASLSADAATRVWNGGGGADTNWTTAANWGGTAPVAGDVLQFAGTTSLTTTNNFAANTSFASITFNAGAGAFVLNGNAVSL